MSNSKDNIRRSAREISQKIKINVEEEFRIATDMIIRIEGGTHSVISRAAAVIFSLRDDLSKRPASEMPELLQQALEELDKRNTVPFEQLDSEDSRMERLREAIDLVFDVFTDFLARKYSQIRTLSLPSKPGTENIAQIREIRNAVLGQVERLKDMLNPMAEQMNQLTEDRQHGETVHVTHIGKAAITRWQNDLQAFIGALSTPQGQAVSAVARK